VAEQALETARAAAVLRAEQLLALVGQIISQQILYGDSV
jgi:hypothetical protein